MNTLTTLNPVAVTSADLLRAIEAGGWASRSELAESVGRKPNNIARDLGVLEAAGLIAIDPDKAAARTIVLTDEGKAQLAAIARAEHGGDPGRVGSGDPEGSTTAAQGDIRVRGRAPFDRFIPNPANRPVRDEAVRAAADTIEAVGDVVQPVEVTPPDANGVRMFLDGEHRWRACLLLEAEGRLPDALKDGLKFEEREATDAEQILIRIVTATARADLSPLDDARQLLGLHQATGWSAREIAKKTGRSPADSESGVRDVQVKIKVAKEATDFFLKQYELDGSWDRLRDSVTEKKSTPERPKLTRLQSLGLAEAFAKACRQTDAWFDVPADADQGQGAAELVRHGFIELHLDSGEGTIGRVTPAGAAWLEAEGLTGAHIASIREQLGFPAKWGVAGWSTHWLRTGEAPDDEAPATPQADATDNDSPDSAHPHCGESVRALPWIAGPIRALNVKSERVSLQPFSHSDGSWFVSVDAQIGSAGFAEPNIVSARLPAFDSQLDALKHARRRVMDRFPILSPEMRDWLDRQLGPHYVNGVDRLNASNAGEARRALGWDKRPSNSGGGSGKAPSGGALKQAIDKVAAGPASPPPELTPSAVARLHAIADWIDDNPSGNGAGFQTLALGRPLDADEELLIATGHLLSCGEAEDAAIYLTGAGTRYVNDNPTPGEAELRERNRLACEAAKADPAPAEATDNAAIDAMAEQMRKRAERHRQRGGGRWTVFSERELARQLLDAVGNGQIERAAVLIAWLSAREGRQSERSKAVEQAGGAWLLSTQLMDAFRHLADAARLAADPDQPAHLVQTAAADALSRARPHLRPIAPMAAEVTS